MLVDILVAILVVVLIVLLVTELVDLILLLVVGCSLLSVVINICGLSSKCIDFSRIVAFVFYYWCSYHQCIDRYIALHT